MLISPDDHYIDFETFPLVERPAWRTDTADYAGPFSESGEYYIGQGIEPPPAKRNSIPMGENGWLVAELYTRTQDPILIEHLDVIPDPADPGNTVLKLMSPAHTDGVVLRPKEPLPESYELSYRLGYANFGGEGSRNGYDAGDETSEPWSNVSALGHNGFYWLAIIDTRPMPHNNTWSHHHRKFHIDTWNNKTHGRGVNIAAIDGRGDSSMRFGKPFFFYDGGNWRRERDIFPADFYKPMEWYTVTFRRENGEYYFNLRGNFFNRGDAIGIEGTLNLAQECVFHFNQSVEEMQPGCVDNESFLIDDQEFVHWPLNSAYPDYFMIGDPHINFYEGSLLIDDIRLKVL